MVDGECEGGVREEGESLWPKLRQKNHSQVEMDEYWSEVTSERDVTPTLASNEKRKLQDPLLAGASPGDG